MANDPLALTEIVTKVPSEVEDYHAIYTALMETARGRWFLSEYADRNRHADTTMLVAALARVEAAIRGEPPPPQAAAVQHAELAEIAAAIDSIEAEIAEAKAPKPDGMAALERMQDIAFVLHERPVEHSLCDALDAAIREISAAGGRPDRAVESTRRATEQLRDLAGRLRGMVAESSGARSTQSKASDRAAYAPIEVKPTVAETAAASAAPGADDERSPQSVVEVEAQQDEKFAQAVAALAVALPADAAEPAPHARGEAAPAVLDQPNGAEEPERHSVSADAASAVTAVDQPTPGPGPVEPASSPLAPSPLASSSAAPSAFESILVEPVAAMSDAVEPFLAKSIAVEPSPVELSLVEPSPVEPSPGEPSPTEPPQVEPQVITQAPIGPSSVAASAMQPTTVEPAIVEPTTVEPTTFEPMPPDVPIGQPAGLDPGFIQPSATEALPIEPSRTVSSPVAPSPLEPVAIERTPIETTPVEPAPVESTSFEQTPFKQTPVERNVVEPTPATAFSVEPRSTEQVHAVPQSDAPASRESLPGEPSSTQPSSTQPSSVEPSAMERSSSERSAIAPLPTASPPVEPLPVEIMTGAPVEGEPIHPARAEPELAAERSLGNLPRPPVATNDAETAPPVATTVHRDAPTETAGSIALPPAASGGEAELAEFLGKETPVEAPGAPAATEVSSDMARGSGAFFGELSSNATSGTPAFDQQSLHETALPTAESAAVVPAVPSHESLQPAPNQFLDAAKMARPDAPAAPAADWRLSPTAGLADLAAPSLTEAPRSAQFEKNDTTVAGDRGVDVKPESETAPAIAPGGKPSWVTDDSVPPIAATPARSLLPETLPRLGPQDDPGDLFASTPGLEPLIVQPAAPSAPDVAPITPSESAPSEGAPTPEQSQKASQEAQPAATSAESAAPASVALQPVAGVPAPEALESKEDQKAEEVRAAADASPGQGIDQTAGSAAATMATPSAVFMAARPVPAAASPLTVAAPAAPPRPIPPQPATDPLAPVRALSAEELIALFS